MASKYVYNIDQLKCISCGTCDVGCEFSAIVVSELGKFSINQEKCKGCGICFRDCPKDAITKTEKN